MMNACVKKYCGARTSRLMVQMFGDFERGIPPGEYDHLQYVVLVLLCCYGGRKVKLAQYSYVHLKLTTNLNKGITQDYLLT